MPTSEVPRAVVFDVDGTLVDSNYLHVVAWARAFAAIDRPVAMSRIHHEIGKGASDAVRTLLDDPGDDVVDRALELHAERFTELHGELRPLPGARDLVHEVARRGYRVVLASSAEEADHEANLAALDLDDVVHGSTQADQVDRAKPDPELFERALDIGGVAADRAVAVGDTRWDVEAARRAGYACLGVTSGGIAASELEEAGAPAVYADPRALLDDLDEALSVGFGG
jgi:HAD superfamily hydrolase (TIGR01509 family)